MELKTTDGHTLEAYHAPPVGERRGGLLLIQEIFGVNDHIRGMCDRYAVEGYEVLAPALFDRVERGVELGYGPEDREKAMGLLKPLTPEATLLDLEAALSQLAGNKLGVVGYCWGGTLAWTAAQKLPVACAVGYYGGGITKKLDEPPRVPVMLHFGRQDHHIPATDAEAISARYPETQVFLYEAGHGFNCEKRPDYHPASAQLAWDRSLEFFRRHLG